MESAAAGRKKARLPDNLGGAASESPRSVRGSEASSASPRAPSDSASGRPRHTPDAEPAGPRSYQESALWARSAVLRVLGAEEGAKTCVSNLLGCAESTDADNSYRLILSTDYSGMGCAEMALDLIMDRDAAYVSSRRVALDMSCTVPGTHA